MSRSSPKPNFFSGKKNLFVLFLTIVVVAAVYSLKPPFPRVTISGLDLDDTRSSVTSDLEHLDYRHFSTGTWSEHFYRMDSPNIEVVYDETDSVHRLEGGVPEIDGVDASRWSLAEIEQALGPCPRAGSSGAVGGEDRAVLSYPQHRLLIYMEKSGNRFILFESGRS